MTFDQTSFQRFDAERSARLAAGLASPLWATFFAAAGAGVAFWWATGWARRTAEAAAPSFVGAEAKSFAPVRFEPAEEPAPAANDVVVVAPEAVMEHAEPEAPVVTDLPTEEAPVASETVMEHRSPDGAPETTLLAAEEALAEAQAEVAQLAAAAATEDLAAKPRRGKKA